MTLSEFALIGRYFDRVKVSRHDVETGIGDDCALLNVPEKHTLAISTDTLVCGRHFFSNINPSDLAYKALAVNISDMAAMGADLACLTLALTLPEINKEWLKSFSDSLFEQLRHYNIQLIGGDTTSGPLSITPAIYGYIPIGCAIKRSKANPGDWIYVTGTLGDSAAGLAILQKRFMISDVNDASWLIMRHLRPTPRILHGQALRGLASSAIDLSDGLISALSHILKASLVGAKINLDSIPFSAQMFRHVQLEQALYWALSGGEDYELCFTVPEFRCNQLHTILSHLNIKLTCIGQITEKSQKLKFLKNGKFFPVKWKGYDHFFKNIS